MPRNQDDQFNALPFRDKLDHLYQVSSQEKRNLILSSSEAARLVRSFEIESLFYTLKEIGLEDSTELVSLASGEQLQGMVDLDCWKKDRLDTESTLDWLAVMSEGGSRPLGEFLNTVDLELLVCLLQRFIRVYRSDDPEEPPEVEGLEVFELDEHYKLVFHRWGARGSLIRQLLEELHERDYSYFVTVMEEVWWGIPSALEEFSFQRRNARLQDRGFPDYFEALEIYRPLYSRDLPERPAPLDNRGGTPSEDDLPQGQTLLLLEETGSFFAEVLHAGFRAGGIDELRQELAFLSNRIIVAEGVDYADREQVNDAVRIGHDTVNLALEFLSGVDRERAITLLRRHHIQHLFRLGRGLLLDVRRRARAAVEGLGIPVRGSEVSFLDTPYREALAGFLYQKPRFFRGLDVVGEIGTRPFATLDDLETSDEILRDVASLPDVAMQLLGQPLSRVAALRPRGADDFRLSATFLTAFAHFVLSGRPRLEPLALDQLAQLSDRARVDGRSVIRPELREEFLGFVGTGRGFLEFCLRRLEEELLGVPAGTPVDPRYVSCLMIESGPRAAVSAD